MNDISNPPVERKVVRDVWAVFAYGFSKNGVVACFSYQQQYPSAEIAEAAGLIRWRNAYPKASDIPSVAVLGPYVKELP